MTPQQKELVSTVVSLLNEASGDRDRNLNNVAAVMGAVFAYLGKQANPKDCVDIVNRAMAMVGWKN